MNLILLRLNIIYLRFTFIQLFPKNVSSFNHIKATHWQITILFFLTLLDLVFGHFIIKKDLFPYPLDEYMGNLGLNICI